MLNTAKAAAYSGMLMLFPRMLVVTTLIAQVPEGTTLLGEIRGAYVQIFPADTMRLLQSSLQRARIHSAQLLFSAASLSVFAGLGLMLSLMEGFRRAYRLPRTSGVSGSGACRALLLVPSCWFPCRWPRWC